MQFDSQPTGILLLTGINQFQKACLLFLCIASPTLLYSQDNADTVVIRYLRSVPGLPEPFLKVAKNGHKGIRTQNYFNEPNEPIVNDSTRFITYLFGSSASHSRKYFLIQIQTENQESYKIIDDGRLEDAIKALYTFFSGYNLPDSKKAVFLNQLTYAYF